MVRTPSILSRASLLLLPFILASAGCKDDEDDPGDGDTDGALVCPDCQPGQEVYVCIIQGKEKPGCYDDLAQAQAACALAPGNGVLGNAPMPCDSQIPDPSVPWTPGSFVVYDEVSRTYELERQFVLNILDDPNLLLHDRARLEWRSDRFEFENIAQGDLADLLGFVNGDALSEINGYPLSTVGDIATAYEALREESLFSVAIVRGEATIVLAYRIIDDG